MADDLKKVGVEMVVESLGAFMSDMKKANSGLQSMRGEGTLLERAFKGIGETLSGFGRSIVRIAEVTIGVLLRDAIRAAIDWIGDMVKATVEAGTEFQTLKIRLQGFNLDAAIKAGESYDDAMQTAVDVTKDQLEWLQALGAASPFDPVQLANVFTMARSYGYAADEAKRLTSNVVDYTAGMGLGNEAIESVVRNLGQMLSRGKITRTEIRDLTRSAFLPLSTMMERMAEKMGMPTEELDKMISTMDGVPADIFTEAFNEMVEEEPRFVGAAGRLGRAFLPAIENAKELIKSFGGLNLLEPIFTFLGEKIAGLVDQFVSFNEQGDLVITDRFYELRDAVTRVSDAILDVMQDLFDFGDENPTEGFVDGIIDGIGGIADWIGTHKEDILGFFDGIGEKVDIVSQWVEDTLVPAFNNISQWVDDNSETIMEFFGALGEIVGEFFSDLMGGREGGEEGSGFLEMLTNIMEFVIDNKDEITKWVGVLWSLFVVWQVVATVLSFVGGVLLSLGGVVLGVFGAVTGFVGTLSLLSTVLGVIPSPIGLVILGIGLLIGWFVILAVIVATKGDEILGFLNTKWAEIGGFLNSTWTEIGGFLVTKWEEMNESVRMKVSEILGFLNTKWEEIKNNLSNKWDEIKNTINTKWGDIKNEFISIVDRIKSVLMIDWVSVGRSIVDGIANGISSFASRIADASRNAALDAFNAAKDALKFGSPSKLFMEIGIGTMESMALGIQKSAGLAAATMQGAMATVSSAAVPSVTNSTVVNNSNAYNLTVNSGADSEPILQDFNMMQSLAGA